MFFLLVGALIALGIGMLAAAGKQMRVAATNAEPLKPGAVIVRSYQNNAMFERDANKLVRSGWTIQTQSTRTKKFSAGTGVLTNKGIVTVTYVYQPAT